MAVVVDPDDVPPAVLDGVCASVVLLVEEDEPLDEEELPELEELAEPEDDDPLEWDVPVVLVSGSTYC